MVSALTGSIPSRLVAESGLRFHEPDVLTTRAEDGSVFLRCARALEPRPNSLLAWLQRWAAVHPARAILAERDAHGEWRSITYEQAWSAVRSLGTSLSRLGAHGGRPVAILSENSIEHALMTWAAHHAGVPVAPISPAYSLADGPLGRLVAASKVVDPWVVFVQDARRFARAIEAIGVPHRRVIAVEHASQDMSAFATLAQQEADPALDDALSGRDPDHAAKYMFTSGSTGVPKAVVVTHGMLTAAVQSGAQVFENGPSDPMTQVDWLPWHHTMGGNVVLGRLLKFGGTLYIDQGKPVPGRFETTLANLRDVAPTFLFNVPAGYAMLVAEFERDSDFARHVFSRLEYAYFSGASLPEDVYARFQAAAQEAVGREVTIGTAFAATETTGAVIARTWHTPQTACIGLPLPGAEIKLVPDALFADRYELRVRGPGVFSAYLRAPEQSAASFDEAGFYRLGDAVQFVDPSRPEQGLLFAGRFTEDFKLANGTWVRTTAMRAELLEACGSAVRELVLVGEGRASIACLAWLDPQACRREAGLEAHTPEAEVAQAPAIRALLAKALDAFNRGKSAATSRIEALVVSTEPLSSEHYELTDKGSVNQRAVIARRAHSIHSMYATPPGEGVIVARRC